MRADHSTEQHQRNAALSGLVKCPWQGHTEKFYIINCREFLAFICLKICEILITLDKSVINLSRGTNLSFKIPEKEYKKSEAKG